MNKSEAGRLGGKRTFEKYGSDHMRAIGKRGALVFHAKYQLVPVHMSEFAIVDRLTGKVVNVIGEWVR